VKHEPVLLEEVLGFLEPVGSGVLVDATIGLGGHAFGFLERYQGGRVIGIDRDVDMIERAKERLAPFAARTEYFHAPFSRLEDVLDQASVETVDGFLFDFGVASPQLDSAVRGFSFKRDGPLDMRMDRSSGTTAAELVNRLPEKELGNLIYKLGEERSSRRVAAAIVAERRRAPIETTGRLAEIVRRAVRGRGKIDAATRTFMALRCAVNSEMEEIEAGLEAAARRLRPGGRVVTISFHSGEDRIVKNFFRSDDRLDVLTKKVVQPTNDERRHNPRARSAKLRAAERRRMDA